MKHIYKASTDLFMALVVFAMIFTGCKKSDSNNGGGVTPIPTDNYGTIHVGDQTYTIRFAGYNIEYNSMIQANALAIVFVDGINENANSFGVYFPDCEELPIGTFNYSGIMTEGQCYGVLTSSDNNILYCTSGSVTITKNVSNYKVESEGTANTLVGTANTAMNFSVNFSGPIYNETE